LKITAAAFVVSAILIAYGAFLLFQTPSPRIVTVARYPTTWRRAGGGGWLPGSLKLRGSGLRPTLRAAIDATPALGFAFEDPNSAEVLVGTVAAGAHDLVLYDGAREVARLRNAVVIGPSLPARVIGVGALIHLDQSAADLVTPGALAPEGPDDAILELGPPQEEPPGVWRRPARVALQCDVDPNAVACTIAGSPLASLPLATVKLVDGSGRLLTFRPTDVFPDTPPVFVTAATRFAGPAEVLNQISIDDRDVLLDERAAAVVAIGNRQTAGGAAYMDVRLRLGADERPEGLQYRGRPLKAGARFRLATERYALEGTLLRVQPDTQGSR